MLEFMKFTPVLFQNFIKLNFQLQYILKVTMTLLALPIISLKMKELATT